MEAAAGIAHAFEPPSTAPHTAAERLFEPFAAGIINQSKNARMAQKEDQPCFAVKLEHVPRNSTQLHTTIMPMMTRDFDTQKNATTFFTFFTFSFGGMGNRKTGCSIGHSTLALKSYKVDDGAVLVLAPKTLSEVAALLLSLAFALSLQGAWEKVRARRRIRARNRLMFQARKAHDGCCGRLRGMHYYRASLMSTSSARLRGRGGVVGCSIVLGLLGTLFLLILVWMARPIMSWTEIGRTLTSPARKPSIMGG
jgi:hypothetical protein